MSKDRQEAHSSQAGEDKSSWGRPYQARPTPEEVAAGVPGTEAFRGEAPLGQQMSSGDARPKKGEGETTISYDPNQPPAD